MKIDFTKREYHALMEMLYLAGWITSAYDEGESSQPCSHSRLEQKILAHAKGFGAEHFVEHEAADKQYYYTKRFEGTTVMQKIIDQYDDNLFWDKLAHRLAVRDISLKYGPEQLGEMDRLAVMKEIWNREAGYGAKFERAGLLAVRVDGVEFK